MTGLLSKTLVVGDAFDAWVEWTVQQIKIEMYYENAVRRMIFQACSDVIAHWRDTTVKMQRARAMMTRLGRRGQSKAFNTWVRNAYFLRVVRTHTDALRNEHEAAQRVVKAALQKIRTILVTKALDAWKINILEKISLRDTMRKVIKRVTNLKVAAAMRGWVAMVSAQKSMRDTMSKVIKRVANMKLAVVLASWVDMTVEAYLRRMRVTKVIKRIAYLKASRAYITWTRFVHNEKLQRGNQECLGYKTELEAFEQRLDSTLSLSQFAVGATRLRKPGSSSPRSTGSPLGTSRAEARSILRARADAKAGS